MGPPGVSPSSFLRSHRADPFGFCSSYDVLFSFFSGHGANLPPRFLSPPCNFLYCPFPPVFISPLFSLPFHFKPDVVPQFLFIVSVPPSFFCTIPSSFLPARLFFWAFFTGHFLSSSWISNLIYPPPFRLPGSGFFWATAILFT